MPTGPNQKLSATDLAELFLREQGESHGEDYTKNGVDRFVDEIANHGEYLGGYMRELPGELDFENLNFGIGKHGMYILVTKWSRR